MALSIVKTLYLNASGASAKPKGDAHVRYIAFRPGKDGNRVSRTFFGHDGAGINAAQVVKEINASPDRGVLIHKLILSPSVSGVDLEKYTRELLQKWEELKGLSLRWRAVIHDNTEHPHAHVVIFGQDENKRQVHIKPHDLDTLRTLGDDYLKREHPELLELARMHREAKKTKSDTQPTKTVEHITILTEYGPMEITKSDQLKHLQNLADGWVRNEPWIKEQLTKTDFLKLRSWIESKKRKKRPR